MTKGQEAFVEQMTRKMMVEWCHMAILDGNNTASIQDGDKSPYTLYAVSKKWIAFSGEPSTGWCHFKILSGGWDTATRFLKR